MRLNLTIGSALLGLLVGMVAWALHPSYKAFSWVETVELDYFAGFLPDRTAFGPGDLPPLSIADYEAALSSLTATVQGDYDASVGIGGMGRRLVLEGGESHPVFFEQYVTPGYFAGRNVGAALGRLPEPGELGVVVIGHAFAERVFADPRSAVGQRVTLASEFRSEEALIVGVLGPSPSQNPEIDIDEGVAGTLAMYLAGNPHLATLHPLHLQVTFPSEAAAERLVPAVRDWAKGYFGPDGDLAASTELFTEAGRAELAQTATRIGERRTTFIAFGAVLALAALLALHGQSYFRLVRQRQLLGVEKALGATRSQLVRRLVLSQLPWGAAGTLLGLVGLWSLRGVLPGVFLTHPPLGAALAGAIVPLVALAAMGAFVSLPILRDSALTLLRGRLKGRRIRPLMWLVYGGLALAIAGGLAAAQVRLEVQREIASLQGRFGSMHALQTGAAIIDDRLERSFEAGSRLVPVFTADHAIELAALPGVEAASLAQSLPNLSVTHAGRSEGVRAMAADAAYLGFMGLELQRGDASGCVGSAEVARSLGAGIGDVLTLEGLTGPVECALTGVMQEPHELWPWLVVDLPQLVTPPLDGLGLALPGYDAQPFRSLRVLLDLDGVDAEAAVLEWLSASLPTIDAELIPYTPDVETLLASLRVQAQVFLLMALTAAALCGWALVAGFAALLEAERFRLALDRALGLTVNRMRGAWLGMTIGLGLTAAAAGAALAAVLATRLYDALALDVSRLPGGAPLALETTSLVAVAAVVTLVSTALTLSAADWLARQPALGLLKEGA